MKIYKRFYVIFTAVMILSLIMAGSALAKSPNKMDICHNNGNGTYDLVKIKVNTLQTHLAHGDAAPGEAVPGQAGSVFAANCAVTTVAQNEPAPSVTVPLTNTHGKKADKVDVCHRRGNETFIMINVSRNALPAHLFHGDGLPNEGVPGQAHQKFSATCGITEVPQKELVQTFSVSSTSTTPVSSLVLDSGQQYEIKASGTYTYYTTNDWADAEWLLSGGQILKDLAGYPPNVLDLTINGCSNNTDWGDYQSSHVYTLKWLGTGAPLTFVICDTFYGDNKGSLTVEIWKINW